MKKYKVLNLYAGIGGNRKLWDNCQVTAVEINPEIAAIYKDFFPDDIVIIGDAHQYLLDHFKEFDFIWSSPPCQSHSITNHYLHAQGVIRYPVMNLYQEIIFLQYFFKGKYVIENVKPYYEPLLDVQIIKPSAEIGRHLFWSNFQIPKIKTEKNTLHRFAPLRSNGKRIDNCKDGHFNFFIDKYKVPKKEQIRRNCVNPELGKHIFNRARNIQIEENTPQGKIIFS